MPFFMKVMSWKIKLLPPPVGIQMKTSLPFKAHLMMAFWLFLNSLTWGKCLRASLRR